MLQYHLIMNIMNMKPSRVLQKLRRGQVVSCLKAKIACRHVVEIAGMLRFDCMWVNLEHTVFDWLLTRRASKKHLYIFPISAFTLAALLYAQLAYAEPVPELRVPPAKPRVTFDIPTARAVTSADGDRISLGN